MLIRLVIGLLNWKQSSRYTSYPRIIVFPFSRACYVATFFYDKYT